MQFGRSPERLTRQIEQLELRLEELEAVEAEKISRVAAADRPLRIREGERQSANQCRVICRVRRSCTNYSTMAGQCPNGKN
jgi:hypothetical protein